MEFFGIGTKKKKKKLAEGLAPREGLEFAKACNLHVSVMESDAINVVRTYSNVPRNGNKVANQLVFIDLCSSINFVCTNHIPLFMADTEGVDPVG